MKYYKKWLDKNAEGEFETIEKDGVVYDIGEMLHGYCDLFALELGKVLREKNIPFQYGIAINEDGMVHTFVYVECDESVSKDCELFIDVRGIISDGNEFFDEFSDFFDYDSFWDIEDEDDTLEFFESDEELKKKIEELCYEELDWYFNGSELKEIIEKAQKIIEVFQEYYIP